MSVKTARTSKELVEAARTCLSESNFTPAKAGEFLTGAVQQDPTFVNALVLRSNLASRLGQLTAAIADLSLAIEVDRGSSDTRRVASLYGSRSSLLARAGRHADAIADLRAALKCEPDNGVWAFELGRAYLRDGLVVLAQMSFQQALQEPMWSHVNESTRPKIYALYGRSCLMSRDYKKAKTLLGKSLEVGGEGAAVLHDVGLAHYHEGSSPTSAIDFFARATEMDAQPLEYPTHLALAHTRCGNYNDALSSMNEAVLRGQDEALLRFYRGCVELQLGLGPQALVDLQAAAEQHGAVGKSRPTASARRTEDAFGKVMTSSAPVWIAMALVHLFCEHSLDMTSLCLTQALHNNPDLPQRTLAGIMLGIVLHHKGETFAAVRALLNVVFAARSTASTSSNASQTMETASLAERGFHADMELLVLTHAGLAYSACGYADLALRFFSQARLRTQQRGTTAQLASCLFREAVALVELRDNWGALQAIQSSALAEEGSATSTRAGRAPPSLSSTTTTTTTTVSSAPSERISAVPSFLIPHRQSSGEVAHLHAVTLRRLGRLADALHFATKAVEAQRAAAVAAEAAVRVPRTSAGGSVMATPVTDVPPAYLYNRALIHFQLGDYAEAMDDVQACIQTRSTVTSADPHYLQGCIAHATGKYTDALASLSTALELDETLRTSPAFSYSHGVLLAIAGRHEDAIVAFTAAITHSEEAPDGGTRRCPTVYHHERAKVCQQMGRYAEALADYNCVLPKTGTIVAAATAAMAGAAVPPTPGVNWNALVNRALTLKELKRYDEGAVDWDVAVRLDRSGCLAHFTSGDVFETPYLELCLPGCELYPAPQDER